MVDFIYSQIMLFVILASSYFLFKFAIKKQANSILGYRTRRSSMNKDNWTLANTLCAKYIIISSLINIGIGFIFTLFFTFNIINYNDNYLYLVVAQIILTFVCIYIIIENKLKK